MDHRKNNSLAENVYRNQPIMCPWITCQPYHSTQPNKNRTSNATCSSINNQQWSNGIVTDTSKPQADTKTCPSMQQSSSQFFYFLRLMQLFPDTHPATLHTVLTLCKNDFFCAVDKLLYAKRCKALYNRRFQKGARFTPYSNFNNVSEKNCTPVKEANVGKTIILKNVENKVKPMEEQTVTVENSVAESPVPEENDVEPNSSAPTKTVENVENLSNVASVKPNC